MKNTVKKRVCIFTLFLVSLTILSCDLLQLRPAERDNPLDPSSGSFSLPLRSWEDPIFLETDDSGDTNYPQVAFDASGNALAVWQQSGNIMARRYTAGAWSTAEAIDAVAGGADKPQVAFDASGNAMAVWYQFDGSYNSIYANRYIAGDGWGTAEQIETNDGEVNDPQVAVDSAGNAIAVWEQSDGTYFSVWTNRYTAGDGWGTAALLETVDSGDVDQPQVSFDSSGNAIAVWHQSDGSVFSIWTNRCTAGTGWGTAELLETDDSGDAYDTQIAFDPSGNAIAVWEQFDGSYYSIRANRYTAGAGWGTAVFLETDGGDTWNPQLSVDSYGNALVVWSQSDGSTFSIRANSYTAGDDWGDAEVIGSGSGSMWNPQVAADAYGNAVAVWWQQDSINNIWTNRYTVGTGWGTAELLETEDTGNAARPQVAIDSSGNAIAVWRQFDGTRENILAAHYR